MSAVSTAPRTAAQIMQRDVVTVKETWEIREALQLFEQRKISGAPVIDRNGSLVGVLSITDIARGQAIRELKDKAESEFYRSAVEERLPSGFHVESYDAIPVSEVMTPLVIDAPENTPVARLAALMVDLHIHRVIITRDGKLVGIVSSLDLLKLLRQDE
jgi:CBS domain-containing protein